MALNPNEAPKTPAMFSGAYALINDYDGTVAKTFEKSPGGIGVTEANEAAVETLFGPSGIDEYRQSGGLRNRHPREVVRDLSGLAEGEAFNGLTTLTERYIEAKLGLLIGEIGTRFPDGSMWPRPTTGYLELREKIENTQTEGFLVDELILSSGHDSFIRACYRAWGVNLPSQLITVETIDTLEIDVPKEELVKPDPRLMNVVAYFWRRGYGIDSFASLSPHERARMISVGDDLNKDGELAKNSGVEFMLLDPENSLGTWQVASLRLGLGELAVFEDRAHA